MPGHARNKAALALAALTLAAAPAGAQRRCNRACPRAQRDAEGCCPAATTHSGAPTGSLYVTTAVDGVHVLLDGEPAGATPVRIDGVATGDHVVELRPANGTTPQTVTVRRNALATLTLAAAATTPPVGPAAVSVSVPAAPAPYSTSTREAFSSTQNPAGDWVLGTRSALGAAFVVYVRHERDQPHAGMEYWSSPAGLWLSAQRNYTSAPLPLPDGPMAPGRLELHPGPGTQFSVARWTAPAPGTYAINATFTGLSANPGITLATTEVHVALGGRIVHSGFLNRGGSGNASSYRGTATLAAGEVVEFLVGSGDGDFGFDGTFVDATITR